MIELLRSNDPVLLSYALALLADDAIEAYLLDTHISVLEGSIGILPRRLMVGDGDLAQARALLCDAGIDHGG